MKIYNDFKDFPHTKWTPFDNHQLCPPNSYIDVRGKENSDVMDAMLRPGNDKPVLFDL